MKEKFYSFTIILAFVILPFISKGQDNYGEVVNLGNSDQAPVSNNDDDGASSGKGFSLGLKAGMDLSSWSNVEVTDPVKEVSQLGFQGGLVGKIGFNKYLALQFEVLYAQKGLRVEVPQLDSNDQEIIYHSWYSVNYLEIPLLFKISVPLGPVAIYGNLGPYAGIGLSAKTATDPDLGRNEELNFQIGGFNRFDFGLVFGAGIGYEIWKGELFLDFRYGYGLSDINNVTDEAKALPEYKEYNNRNIGIAIGYLIRLGK